MGDSFAASVRALVHDLKNPTAAVVGNARLVLDTESIPGEAREALEDVLAAALLIDRGLQDVADICRWVEGALQASVTDCGLLPIWTGAMEAVAARLERRRQKITVEGTLPAAVRADAALLRRALIAMLEAAIVRSPSGSTVTLRVRLGAGGVRLEVVGVGPIVAPEDAGVMLAPPSAEMLPSYLGGARRALVMARAAIEISGGRFEAGATDGTLAAWIPRPENVPDAPTTDPPPRRGVS